MPTRPLPKLVPVVVLTITENKITARLNSKPILSIDTQSAYALQNAIEESAAIPGPLTFNVLSKSFVAFADWPPGVSEAIGLSDDLAVHLQITIVPSKSLLEKWEANPK